MAHKTEEHEPTDEELKKAEKLAKKLERNWEKDLNEIRKSLHEEDDDEQCYEE